MDKKPDLSATNVEKDSSIVNLSQTLDSAVSGAGGMEPSTTGNMSTFLSPAQAPDELGRLGDYRVLKLLGEGGMGFVFKGEDTILKRDVALKVMRPEVAAKPQAAERFLREGRAAAGLKSDHIITIYQVGQANGVPFMAMEFLQGLPLDAWIKRQAPPIHLPAVLRVVRDTLRGLAVAHDKGLIHRDIKPANLWLEQETSRIKVLDFGLTRSQDSHDQVTADGTVVGTPAYMAPEQAAGRAIDSRADLFSVGAVMYQLLAGKNPFVRENLMGTLGAVSFETQPPITTVRPDVPPEYSAFLDRLLAKDPNGRPANAKAALVELAAIEQKLRDVSRTAVAPPVVPSKPIAPAPIVAPLAQEAEVWDDLTNDDTATDAPPPVRPTSKPTKKGPPPKNKKLLLGGGLAALFAIIAAGVVIIITNKDGSKTKIEVPDGSSIEVQDKGKTVAKVEPKPKVDPKTAKLAIAPPGPWAPPKPIPVGASPFDKLDASAIPKDERFPWQPKELVGVIGSHARRMGNNIWAVAFSPDGKTVATGSYGNQSIMLWDFATQKPLHTVASDAQGLQYSPDGKTLYNINWHNFRALSLAEAEPKWLPITAQGKTDTQWKHDRGYSGAMLEAGKTLLLWDGKAISLYEWNNGEPKLTVDRFAGTRLLVAPQSDKLFYVDNARKLHRVGIRGSQMVGDEVLPLEFKENEGPVAVSGDGKSLAVSRTMQLELWDLSNAPKVRWQIAADNNLNINLSFRFQLSPDGRWLTGTYNAMGLWRVDGAEPKFAGWLDQTGLGGDLGALAFSPDSNRVVVGSESGLVRFWDVSGLEPKELAPFDPNTAFMTPTMQWRMNTDMPAGRVMLPRYDRTIHVRYQLWDCAQPTPNPVPMTTVPKARDVVDTHYGKFHALGANRWLNVGEGGHKEQYTLQGDGWLKTATSTGSPILRGELAPDRSLMVGFKRPDAGSKPAMEGWNVAVAPPVKKWSIPLDNDPVSHNASRYIWFAGDARLFATYEPIAGTNDANLMLWRNTGEQPELAAKIPIANRSRPFAASIAPDGRSICLLMHNQYQIAQFDLTGPQPQEMGLLLENTSSPFHGLEYSPNGRYLAWSNDSGVGVIDLTTRKPVWTWDTAPGAVVDLHWSDDGRHLLLHNNNKTVYVVRLSPDLTAADVDRLAADYVLSVGGSILINGENIVRTKDTPPGPEPFRLTGISFRNRPATSKLTNEGMALLKDCRHVRGLNLIGDDITDEMLANFKGYTELYELGCECKNVTNAGLVHFQQCSGLGILGVGGSVQFTDDGLKNFTANKNLHTLNLAGTSFTGRAIGLLKNFPDLVNLYLTDTPITDDALAFLKDSPKLLEVHLNGTKVTKTGLAHLNNCAVLQSLTLGDNASDDADFAVLKPKWKFLKRLWLGPKISDATFADPKAFPNLEHLNINGSQVTPAKVAQITKELPACEIYYDGKVIPARGKIDADRKAAEWIIAAGGQVALNDVPDLHPAGQPLPVEAFKLTDAYLHTVKVTPEGLALLKACEHVTALNLSNTNLTDEQMATFAGFTKLRTLHVNGPNLTDACFSHFKNCKKLTTLGIAGQRDRNGQQFTDKCLEPFKDCRGWIHLHFSQFALTDAGLAHLQDFSKLLTLGLGSTVVTDKGLARFQDAKELGSVDFNACQFITDAGLTNLKNCQGLRQIGLGNTHVGDAGLEHLAALPNLRYFDLGNTPGTDAGLAHLKKAWGQWEYLQLPNGITDATFADPKAFTNLRTLDVAGAKLTAAKVEAIKQALPKCRIDFQGKTIEPRVK